MQTAFGKKEMISINEIKIETLDDYKKLKDYVDKTHIDDLAISMLSDHLGLKISSILVEWPYYDRDYLSSYYIHHSKKLKEYSKYCYRLHFIAAGRTYIGYSLLRPVMPGRYLGRTYLDPKIIIKEKAALITGEYSSHIFGEKFDIFGFPWMMQETDITVCAHIALWNVLRYYGTKYPHYESPSLGDVVEKVHAEWGRKTPSIGLTPVQVSDVLSAYDFFPIIRGFSRDNIQELTDELLVYLESEVPVIGMSDVNQHAVTFIGRGAYNYELLKDDFFVRKHKFKKGNFILSTQLVNSTYVMDDNLFPYARVDRLGSKESDAAYSIGEMTYLVIPIFERMQLAYHKLYGRIETLFAFKGKNNYSFSWQDGLHVVRIYIASSNKLKAFIAHMSGINEMLKEAIVRLPLSRFVWCVDISTPEEFEQGKISGKILIDTTAGTNESEPWLLMHDDHHIMLYDTMPQDKKPRMLMRFTDIQAYEMYKGDLYQLEN